MFTNITELMKSYEMKGFTEFRVSRKGNWVVSGSGSRTQYWNDGYASGGEYESYAITAVYANDGTGTLINYQIEEIDAWSF
jgi:hypothetical protein